MDTQFSHADTNGVSPTLDADLSRPDVDRLRALANLLDEPVGVTFAAAVEMLRQHHIPAVRPTRSAEPKQPRTPKAKG